MNLDDLVAKWVRLSNRIGPGPWIITEAPVKNAKGSIVYAGLENIYIQDARIAEFIALSKRIAERLSKENISSPIDSIAQT